MRIVKLGPDSVTIEMEIPDCIGVVSGLYQGFDKTAEPLYGVLAGIVKLSTFDGNDGSKVGDNPRSRPILRPRVQYWGR